MAKRTTKRQSKKEYTLTEFKAWLEGIEEMQPADWAPDVRQWKTIREKLLNIVEEVVEVEVPAPVQPQQVTAPAGPVLHRQTAPPAGPAPAMGPPVNAPSALANIEVPESDMTPAAKAALKGNLPSEMITSPDGKTKTSDIDTSNGTYESTFG